MLDFHTHSTNSHDGRDSLLNIATHAVRVGVKHLAFTEHFDIDCNIHNVWHAKNLDIPDYLRDFTAVKKELSGKINLYFGIECGYDALANEQYKTELAKYDFDVILNSVHLVNGDDAYNPGCFEGIPTPVAYNLYLNSVLQSLDVPYPYDIIGHIGYAGRYIPDGGPLLTPDTKDLIDAILKGIIARGKSMEANTSVRTLPYIAIPEPAIFKRYKELGGENISYGSDTHDTVRLCERYKETAELLKSLGFKYFTGYKERKPFHYAL